MGAQVSQAVHPARLLRVAAPLSLFSSEIILKCKPALGIFRHDRAHLPDGAGSHQLPGVFCGHMAHIGIGYHEQKALFLCQGFQFLCLPVCGCHRFIAGHVDSRLQKGPADFIMGLVGRDHHHKVNPVLPFSLGPGHCPVILIAPVRGNAKFFRRL